MAMVQLCCKIPSKEQLLPIPKIVRQNERGFKCHCISLTENSRFSSTSDNMCKRWRSIYPKQDVAELPVQWKMSNITSHVGSFSKKASTKENLRMVRCAAESSDSECQIRILKSYLAKLKDDSIQNSSESSGEIEELHSRSEEINAKTELDSLDAYLGKLNTGKYRLPLFYTIAILIIGLALYKYIINSSILAKISLLTEFFNFLLMSLTYLQKFWVHDIILLASEDIIFYVFNQLLSNKFLLLYS